MDLLHDKTFRLSSRTPRIPFNVLSRTEFIYPGYISLIVDSKKVFFKHKPKKISQRYFMKRGYVTTHVNLSGINYDFDKNLQYI